MNWKIQFLASLYNTKGTEMAVNSETSAVHLVREEKEAAQVSEVAGIVAKRRIS